MRFSFSKPPSPPATPVVASTSTQPGAKVSSNVDSTKEDKAHQLALLAAQNEQRRTELEIAKLNVRREELVLEREEKSRAAAVAAKADKEAGTNEATNHGQREEWVNELFQVQTTVAMALLERFDEVDEAIEEISR